MAAFSTLLARLRRRQALSQSALAALTGLSQRHISFLESGRARAGRRSLKLLSSALCTDHLEARWLYAAAGFAPELEAQAPDPQGLAWSAPAFAPAREAIGRLLDKHEPYPAVVADRAGDVVAVNRAFSHAMAVAFDGEDPWRRTCGTRADNLFDLSLHDDGLPALMVNPETVVPHVMTRLRRTAGTDPKAAKVLERVRRYGPVGRHARRDASGDWTLGVVEERYCVGGLSLNVTSSLYSFGAPEDAASRNLQIEVFFPSDAPARRFFHGRGGAQR